MEQLVRHFLIETGPKGVKIKGCPSEPYFGEKRGLGRLHWAGPGRPRGVRREEVDRGYLRVPRDPTRVSPCRQPVGPGLAALHLPAVPALLPAHSQQRWVSGHLSSHLSPPTAAKGRIPRPWLPACLPSFPPGQQRVLSSSQHGHSPLTPVSLRSSGGGPRGPSARQHEHSGRPSASGRRYGPLPPFLPLGTKGAVADTRGTERP